MFSRGSFKKKMFNLLAVVIVLLIMFTSVFFVRVFQLPEHQEMAEKMYSLKLNDIKPLVELRLIAEEYNINILEIEQACGKRCGRYHDQEGDTEEWDRCSKECDADRLTDEILSKANRRIIRVEDWWDVRANRWMISDAIKAFRQFLPNILDDIAQYIEDEKEFQQMEIIYEHEIPKLFEKLKKIRIVASEAGINTDEKITFCHDGL